MTNHSKFQVRNTGHLCCWRLAFKLLS